MPKPNQTMLDQLVKTFKSTGNKKPQFLRTTYPDKDGRGYFSYEKLYPNAAAFEGRVPDLTPERVKYQRGLEAIQNRNLMKAQNELDDLNNDKEILQCQWDDAVEEAKDAMYEDWRNSIDDYDFSDIDPFSLEVSDPSTDLSDYWPAGMSPREYGQRAERLDEDISEWEDIVGHRESPAYRMELQRQSPRYRNYQRAMRQRQENAQVGRLNAAIMNLYRRGYSMPEIREILRNQRMQ